MTTADEALAGRIRTLRNHGITADHRERQAQGSWFYEMVELGFNYRLTDFQCALGASQLRKLPAWVARRRQIAARYDRAFAELPGVERLRTREGVSHAYHLYVVRFRRAAFGVHRDTMFSALRAEGLGVNVHYVPVHLHPFYRQRFGTRPGQCPVAEAAHEEILTLPLFPAMTEQDVEDVIAAVGKVVAAYAL